jgi:hypothetical protein
MTAQFVQFSDATETVVRSVYSTAQDPVAHPNQGVIDDTDPRYTAFMNPPAPPLTATPLQFRLGLTQAGIRAAVETWIPTASQADQDAYAHAQVFVETDTLIVNAAAAMTPAIGAAEIHTLFQAMQTLSP